MPTAEGLRRYLAKRGIKATVLPVGDGFSVVTRHPEDALSFLAQTAETCEFTVAETPGFWGRLWLWLRHLFA